MGTPLIFLRGSAVPRLVAQESEDHGGAQKLEQQRGGHGQGYLFLLAVHITK